MGTFNKFQNWIRIRKEEKNGWILISVADPGPEPFLTPGSEAFLTPGSGMGKKSRSGSGMNIPDHISESLETTFWVKNTSIL
jgi:hypothetical protein